MSNLPFTLQLQADEVSTFLAEVYPLCQKKLGILHLKAGEIHTRWAVSSADQRPGGTLSGPTMFTAADASFYALTLAMIGRQALAVTSSLNIHFLRKPAIADLECKSYIRQLGRQLIVGDCLLYSSGDPRPVAQASVVYARPSLAR